MASVPDEEAIRLLVARSARPHRSGGRSVERAALLAAGADCSVVIPWICARGGAPEAPAGRSHHGLYGARDSPGEPKPLRYVLPAGALEREVPAPVRGRETP